MWHYVANSGHPDDGYILMSPTDVEVGLIDDEVYAKEICAMLNEALVARNIKKESA